MWREMVTAWRQAGTAEMVWATRSGPRGIPVVPLVQPAGSALCTAVPPSQWDEVESLGDTAAFSVHVSGETPRTLVACGRVDVRWDLTGGEFVEHLLEQEAAKHPPTRLRADSLMARRENWWWLPRVLITLVASSRVSVLPARMSSHDALLICRPGHARESGGPCPNVVTASHWPRPEETRRLELATREGAVLDGDGEPALVFGHRHSPDFERWETWYRRGTLHNGVLHVESGHGTPLPADARPGAAEPFTLWQRWWNHRRTAQACKAGISRAETRRR